MAVKATHGGCDNDYGFLCISKMKKCGTTLNENKFEERLWAGKSSTDTVTGTTPGKTFLVSSINWQDSGKPSGYTVNFRAEYYGMILISKPGTYTFYIRSDDGTRMTLDGSSFITSNWFGHSMTEKSASRSLAAGWHSIFLEYFQGSGGYGFEFRYKGPGISKRIMKAPPLKCASESGSACEDSLVENESMESVSVSIGGASSTSTVNLQYSG